MYDEVSMRIVGSSDPFERRIENLTFLRFQIFLREHGVISKDALGSIIYIDPESVRSDYHEFGIGNKILVGDKSLVTNGGHSVEIYESLHNVLDANLVGVEDGGTANIVKLLKLFNSGELQSQLSKAEVPSDVKGFDFDVSASVAVFLINAGDMSKLNYNDASLRDEDVELDVLYNFYGLFHNVLNSEFIKKLPIENLFLNFNSPNTAEELLFHCWVPEGDTLSMTIEYYKDVEMFFDEEAERYISEIREYPTMEYHFSMRLDEIKKLVY